MSITMIWFFKGSKGNQKDFSTILAEGAQHFRTKYGQEPVTCLVNERRYQALLEEKGLPPDAPSFEQDGITVIGKKDVLLFDYYISSNGLNK